MSKTAASNRREGLQDVSARELLSTAYRAEASCNPSPLFKAAVLLINLLLESNICAQYTLHFDVFR